RVDRLIELIFPASREEPLRYDPRECRAVVTRACNQHGIALGGLGRITEWDRRCLERHDAANEPEPTRMVVAHDGRRERAALGVGDLQIIRLDAPLTTP